MSGRQLAEPARHAASGRYEQRGQAHHHKQARKNSRDHQSNEIPPRILWAAAVIASRNIRRADSAPPAGELCKT
jgi:hypothetical protein